MKKILLLLHGILILSCSTKTSSEADLRDSTETQHTPGSIGVTSEINTTLDLDIAHYHVYAQGDTSVVFPDLIPHDPMADEPEQLKKDSRVTRVPGGLQFTLKNGSLKIRGEKKETDGDDYEAYAFLETMDEINQWLLIGSYYESFEYILVDQDDGTESHLWGLPVLSPDKRFFLTTQLDLEAGFVSNGFQLWHMENKKPVLRWEKELQDWGAANIIWAKTNEVIAKQTYRNQGNAELESRIIKMKIR